MALLLLKILENRFVDKKIGNSGFVNVINAFPQDKKSDIFNKFLDLYKRDKLEEIYYNLSDILKEEFIC